MVVVEREDAQQFVRQVNSVVGALSRALEQIAFGERTIETGSVEEAYLQLQKIVFQFKIDCGRLRSRDEFDAALSRLQESLAQFTQHTSVGVLRNLRVRLPRLTQRTRLGFLHPALASSQILTASDVVYLLAESLGAAIGEAPFHVEERDEIELSGVELERLRKSIPVQRVAPAQFEISGGVLKVRAQPRTPKENSQFVVGQSFEALVEQGLEIEQALTAGNYDRRLSEKVRQVNDALQSQENIIKLGLQNMTCGTMAKAMANELSDALVAQMEGFYAGLAMYVAQFDEWQTFVQNAAEAAINESSSDEMRNFAESLLKEMSEFKEVIDPQVPITIKFLGDLLSDPKRTSKRVLFAFVRTIENLIIEAFTFLISTVAETAKETRGKIADKGSTYLVRALVSVSLVSAAGLLPVSAQVKGMDWIQGAYHVVKDQVAPRLSDF